MMRTELLPVLHAMLRHLPLAVQAAIDAFTNAIQAPVDVLPLAVQPIIDAIALAIQPCVDAIATPIQPVLDAIALAVQALGQAVLAMGLGPLGPPIQAIVDAFTALVEAAVDAITLAIQARIDAIAPAIQAFLDPVTASIQVLFDPIANPVQAVFDLVPVGGKNGLAGRKTDQPGNQDGILHGCSPLVLGAFIANNAPGPHRLTTPGHFFRTRRPGPTAAASSRPRAGFRHASFHLTILDIYQLPGCSCP
jgi:hypothetical protein